MKIFLTKGDGINWAIDEDKGHIEAALSGVAEITDLRNADVVLALWWAALMEVDPAELIGKRVICLMHGDPARFLRMPDHRLSFGRVNLWGVRSYRVLERLKALGYPAAYIPYKANIEAFSPLPGNDPGLQATRSRLNLPAGAYLVASIGRDSEGVDLRRPKIVKGPDMFAEMMRCALDRGLPVHAVLAGPRRHWLRRRLDELAVPYSFLGEVVEGDDIKLNILSRETLNHIYNIVDLSVVSSRSEGAPMAALEAPVAGCKMISTPVGMADEVLPPEAIFTTAEEGVDLIDADFRGNTLSAALQKAQHTLKQHNSHAAVQYSLRNALRQLSQIPPHRAAEAPRPKPAFMGFCRRVRRFVRDSLRLRPRPPVVRFLDLPDSPYTRHIGQLVRSADTEGNLQSRGMADILFLDPVRVDAAAVASFMFSRRKPEIVAVVADASIESEGGIRVKEALESLGARHCIDATVVSSEAVLECLAKLGYRPPRPVLIPYTPNPAAFFPARRKSSSPVRHRLLVILGKKDRAERIDFLDRIRGQLDWFAAEFVVLGDALPFGEFSYVNARSDAERAEVMRSCDLLVEPTAGPEGLHNIAEAISCGLPVVFRNSYANRERVLFAGRSFDGPADAAAVIRNALSRYESLLRLLQAQQTDDLGSGWKRLADVLQNERNGLS